MVYTNQGGFPCRNPEIQDKTDDEKEPIFANYDYNQILEKENLKIYKIMAVSRQMNSKKSTVQKKQSMEILKCLALHHIRIMSNLPQLKPIKERHYYAIKSYNIQFDEIFAFGDGGNDLEQFKVATTAVAMANAPFTIKQEADVVTKTNDENGFAYAVQHLINL